VATGTLFVLQPLCARVLAHPALGAGYSQGGNTMLGLGYQELLIILVIVLVLFGGSKLPELAKSLGKSVKEFKKGVETEPAEDPAEDKAPKPAPDAPAPAIAAPRACAYCKAPLEATWSHCPRCGTAVAQGSATTPSN
jgi:sec-independent protein translocase protein TatA